MRACSIEDCTRDYYCKGLCQRHYKRTRPRTPDKPVTVECVACGKDVQRMGGGYKPKYGRTCSNECRTILTWGLRSELPEDHWGRWYGATSKWRPPAPDAEPRARFFANQCDECGLTFVEIAYGVPSSYCSTACAKRVSRRVRDTYGSVKPMPRHSETEHPFELKPHKGWPIPLSRVSR